MSSARSSSPGSGSTLRSRSWASSSRFRTSLAGSPGQAPSPQNSPERSRSPIVQPAAAGYTGPHTHDTVSESAPAPTRVQECSAALSRPRPAFYARNSPHPRDGTASEDTYSLRSIPKDGPMPGPTPAFSPQRQTKPQTQAPSTSSTNVPLPSNDITRKKIVIHLSNHEPGPRIIPQKDGVFIRTKYAVEIASVQIGSGPCIDINHHISSSTSTSVSSASGNSSSRILGGSGSSPTSSPSTESDSIAINEIAGLDISKVKPAYFYRVLRAGTIAIQRRSAPRGDSDSALRRRRNRADDLDRG
ncbi:hypothetical protein BDW68DRAFT_195061 [Aspergillus falconensis]